MDTRVDGTTVAGSLGTGGLTAWLWNGVGGWWFNDKPFPEMDLLVAAAVASIVWAIGARFVDKLDKD